MSGLRTQNLVVEYPSGGNTIRPIDGFNLELEPGSLNILLGPSGCGKTTLLSCLGGLLTPTSGRITVGDVDVTALNRRAMTRYRRRNVGIVFQAFNLVPSLTALENVTVPLRAAGYSRRAARERAEELLTRVGLQDRMNHRPGDLSGGQQQRVAVARAIALDPPLILADEPTAHLDYLQVEEMLRLIRELASGDRIVVVATHDSRLLPLADRVIEMVPTTTLVNRAHETIHLEAGTTLFNQGALADLIYVVSEGELELVRQRPGGGQEVLRVAKPGDHFGEIGPLFGLPRSATVRARTDAEVIGYSVPAFRQRLSAIAGKGPVEGREPAMD
jgi:putative ABC transport system ATP-binding protein